MYMFFAVVCPHLSSAHLKQCMQNNHTIINIDAYIRKQSDITSYDAFNICNNTELHMYMKPWIKSFQSANTVFPWIDTAASINFIAHLVQHVFKVSIYLRAMFITSGSASDTCAPSLSTASFLSMTVKRIYFILKEDEDKIQGECGCLRWAL